MKFSVPIRLVFSILLALSLNMHCQAVPSQGIAVIVGAENNASTTLDHLSLIYRRKRNFWEDGIKIQPVNLPAYHPLRRAFSIWLFNRTPEELDDYWKDMYFHGIQPPFVLDSEEAVIRFVTTTPGAIGYINRCQVDHRVRVLLQQDGGPPCQHP